ncbi:MAG: radical SAM family heme chaperone HemW [Gemmobacter sp.]
MFHVKHQDTREDWRGGGFGIYVHWPFCESKCPYCDFNSHVAARIDEGQWRVSYLREIERVGRDTPGRVVQTVFLGGGTPSLMSPELVGAILTQIRSTWRCVNDLEVTLEANPGSVEAGRFAGYRDAGVNRVSIGVQSLRNTDLRRLGRRHDAAEARAAIELALSLFPRVSFDLIYARQDQSLADWRAELHEACAFGTQHLSLYQLTIEPGTPFAARHARLGLRGLPDEDLASDLYETTQEICEAAGLPAYEVSNHARPGEESRHNTIYWQAGDYVGVGPGAHGRLTIEGQRWATEAVRAPHAWLAGSRTGETELSRLCLAPRDQAIEYIMMGMRLRSGLDLRRLSQMLGSMVDLHRFRDLIDWGMVEPDGHMLRTTDRGRMVLNSVIAQAVSDLSLDAHDS